MTRFGTIKPKFVAVMDRVVASISNENSYTAAPLFGTTGRTAVVSS
jgi:hypothetical protein